MLGFIFDHISEKVFNFMSIDIVKLYSTSRVRAPRVVDVRFI